jgi:protein SCO1
MMSRRAHQCIAMLATLLLMVPVWSAAPPTNSIYQLSLPLVDQQGRATKLEDWRGKPVIISMFYASCQFVCPRIVESIKRTESGVATRVPVLLVSFDPARDDVAALKAMADEHNLDSKLWTLARTDARNVRKLAAILGIQYRELPSGEFNHSTLIILLDGEGRVVGKTTMLGEADPAFVKLVKKTK